MFRKGFYVVSALTFSVFLSTSHINSITFLGETSERDVIELARGLNASRSIARGYQKGEDPHSELSVRPVLFVSKKHVLALHLKEVSIKSIRYDFSEGTSITVKVIGSHTIKTNSQVRSLVLKVYELEKEVAEAIPFKTISEQQGVKKLLQSDSVENGVHVFTYSHVQNDEEKSISSIGEKFTLKAAPIDKSSHAKLWNNTNTPYLFLTTPNDEQSDGVCKFILDQNDMGSALVINKDDCPILIGIGAPFIQPQPQTNNRSRILKLSPKINRQIKELIGQEQDMQEKEAASSSSLPSAHMEKGKEKEKSSLPKASDASNEEGSQEGNTEHKEKWRSDQPGNQNKYPLPFKKRAIHAGNDTMSVSGEHRKELTVKEKKKLNIFDNPPSITGGDLIHINSDGTWLLIHQDSDQVDRRVGLIIGASNKNSRGEIYQIKEVEKTEDYLKIVCENEEYIWLYRCGYIRYIYCSNDIKQTRKIYVNGWTCDVRDSEKDSWTYMKPENEELLVKRTCKIGNKTKIVYEDDRIETQYEDGCCKVRSKGHTDIRYPHQVTSSELYGVIVTKYPNGFIFTQTPGSYPQITFSPTQEYTIKEDLSYVYIDGKKETIYAKDGSLEIRYPSGGIATFYMDGNVKIQFPEETPLCITLQDILKNPQLLSDVEGSSLTKLFTPSGRLTHVPEEVDHSATSERGGALLDEFDRFPDKHFVGDATNNRGLINFDQPIRYVKNSDPSGSHVEYFPPEILEQDSPKHGKKRRRTNASQTGVFPEPSPRDTVSNSSEATKPSVPFDELRTPMGSGTHPVIPTPRKRRWNFCNQDNFSPLHHHYDERENTAPNVNQPQNTHKRHSSGDGRTKRRKKEATGVPSGDEDLQCPLPSPKDILRCSDGRQLPLPWPIHHPLSPQSATYIGCNFTTPFPEATFLPSNPSEKVFSPHQNPYILREEEPRRQGFASIIPPHFDNTKVDEGTIQEDNLLNNPTTEHKPRSSTRWPDKIQRIMLPKHTEIWYPVGLIMRREEGSKYYAVQKYKIDPLSNNQTCVWDDGIKTAIDTSRSEIQLWNSDTQRVIINYKSGYASEQTFFITHWYTTSKGYVFGDSLPKALLYQEPCYSYFHLEQQRNE